VEAGADAGSPVCAGLISGVYSLSRDFPVANNGHEKLGTKAQVVPCAAT
jgi:hypothetical protein